MSNITKKKNVRLSCNISVDLMERLKRYSEERGVPVTQGVSFLIYQALDYDSVMKSVPTLITEVDALNRQIANLNDSKNNQ